MFYDDANMSARKSMGHWEKVKVAGRGGSSIVYKGLIKATKQNIAVKEIPTEGLTKEQVAGLLGEVETIRNLTHPNIVRYLGTCQLSNRIHIFLEYADMGSLRQYYQRFGPLTESQASNCTRQILDGLAYLHSHNIAHRDVKGANVLLTHDGCMKLADFGASKRVETESLVSGLKGTPHWMAPEVIKGTTQDIKAGWIKADIWSLGCTVVEMLTAAFPFVEYANPMTAMYHIAQGEIPPLRATIITAPTSPLVSGPVTSSVEPDAGAASSSLAAPTTQPKPCTKSFIATCCAADPLQRPEVAPTLLEHSFIQLCFGDSDPNSVDTTTDKAVLDYGTLREDAKLVLWEADADIGTGRENNGEITKADINNPPHRYSNDDEYADFILDDDEGYDDEEAPPPPTSEYSDDDNEEEEDENVPPPPSDLEEDVEEAYEHDFESDNEGDLEASNASEGQVGQTITSTDGNKMKPKGKAAPKKTVRNTGISSVSKGAQDTKTSTSNNRNRIPKDVSASKVIGKTPPVAAVPRRARPSPVVIPLNNAAPVDANSTPIMYHGRKKFSATTPRTPSTPSTPATARMFNGQYRNDPLASSFSTECLIPPALTLSRKSSEALLNPIENTLDASVVPMDSFLSSDVTSFSVAVPVVESPNTATSVQEDAGQRNSTDTTEAPAIATTATPSEKQVVSAHTAYTGSAKVPLLAIKNPAGAGEGTVISPLASELSDTISPMVACNVNIEDGDIVQQLESSTENEHSPMNNNEVQSSATSEIGGGSQDTTMNAQQKGDVKPVDVLVEEGRCESATKQEPEVVSPKEAEGLRPSAPFTGEILRLFNQHAVVSNGSHSPFALNTLTPSFDSASLKPLSRLQPIQENKGLVVTDNGNGKTSIKAAAVLPKLVMNSKSKRKGVHGKHHAGGNSHARHHKHDTLGSSGGRGHNSSTGSNHKIVNRSVNSIIASARKQQNQRLHRPSDQDAHSKNSRSQSAGVPVGVPLTGLLPSLNRSQQLQQRQERRIDSPLGSPVSPPGKAASKPTHRTPGSSSSSQKVRSEARTEGNGSRRTTPHKKSQPPAKDAQPSAEKNASQGSERDRDESLQDSADITDLPFRCIQTAPVVSRSSNFLPPIVEKGDLKYLTKHAKPTMLTAKSTDRPSLIANNS